MSTYITLDDKIQECLNIIDSHFAYYLPLKIQSVSNQKAVSYKLILSFNTQ